MRRKAVIIFLFLSYISVSSYAQQKETEVTYVGNSGFLIKIGDKKILIDALFKGFAGSYELPQEVQDKLTLAQAPFDDVDLILVTHAHGDHVDPSMVTEHMKNNPNAIFASTQQLVDHLKDSTNRSIGFNPTKEKSDKKEIQGFSIETFLLPHGPDSRIINIGFLISANGITLFQTGDFDNEQYTFEEFRALQLPEKKIDLAFMQHYYLTDSPIERKFVEEGIGAKYIIPIHYHFTTPAFDSILIKQNYPDAILFKKEMHSWEMPQKETRLSNVKGDYLGQNPPGDVPVIFAPGIISVDSTVEHGYPTFSPDGNMVFWQSNLRQKEKETEIFLKVMRRVDGQWTEPESSPYGGMPAFSPDGNKLYFISDDTEKEKGLYFVEKQGENWTEPKSLNIIAQFPELKYLYGPSLTNNGTLYFFGHAEGLGSRNDFGIYRSELINGIYAKPELLPPSINTAEGVINWMPFIAPDESYLLFSSDRNTNRQSLYISFRLSDGSWTEAHGLGEAINSQKGERFPYVSPDGKYLFFTRWHGRDNEDIMWVSAKIIADLKKEVFNSLNNSSK
ncbi:MAG: MBL fold metallo-hydrolase [Bacteroidetes bacterium]|jgi:L-ascorbate metabolism protein UlaG (beta-lactamase superfamily)|nr:MBL fold metallo-hydrolase [Bacteroidota bacterium]MBT7466223.1 MBL fold metallo-hydrolase [Bacteroidota bacterium]